MEFQGGFQAWVSPKETRLVLRAGVLAPRRRRRLWRSKLWRTRMTDSARSNDKLGMNIDRREFLTMFDDV